MAMSDPERLIERMPIKDGTATRTVGCCDGTITRIIQLRARLEICIIYEPEALYSSLSIRELLVVIWEAWDDVEV